MRLTLGLALALAALAAACSSDDRGETAGTATPAPAHSPEPSPFPTVTPSPTQSTSRAALVLFERITGYDQSEDRLWPKQEAVLFDLATARERTVILYGEKRQMPVATSLAESHIITATEHAVVRYALDGTGATDLLTIPADTEVQDIAASPDGKLVAVATWKDFGATCPGATVNGTDAAIFVVEVATARLLHRFEQCSPAFTAFRGHFWQLQWRDDGQALLVAGATHSEAAGGRATIPLNGSPVVHDLAGYTYPSPDARAIAEGAGSLGCMFISGHTVRVTDLDTGSVLATLEDQRKAFTPFGWSPDGKELAVEVRDYPGDNGDCAWAQAQPRVVALQRDGSPTADVGTFADLARRWPGARITLECGGVPTAVRTGRWNDPNLSCGGAPGAVLVDGVRVGDLKGGPGLTTGIIAVSGIRDP